MIKIRRAGERGHFDHGWLDTYHTFSFARYYDPRHMGFRALRVINEDRVRGGSGFGTHGHDDMEIVTCVLEGELAHRDSLGHEATLPPGEFQRMTAGTGIEHSEFNPSPDRPVHLYQIWIEPDRPGRTPEYEQRRFDEGRSLGRFGLVAAPGGEDGALDLKADARIYHGRFGAGEAGSVAIAPGRHAWLQVLRGSVGVSGMTLTAGDGAAATDEPSIDVAAESEAELLLFDLA